MLYAFSRAVDTPPSGRPCAPADRGAPIASGKLARSTALALGLMAIQVAAVRLSPSDLPVRILLPATLAAVTLALWPFRQRFGIWIMYVGLLANLSVIVANGGLMPIEQSAVERAVGPERAASYAPGAWLEGSKDVLVRAGSGRAVALGDSIVVRVGGNGIVASPGDVVIWCGLIVLAGEAAVLWARETRRTRAKPPERTGEPTADAAPGRAQGGAATPQ